MNSAHEAEPQEFALQYHLSGKAFRQILEKLFMSFEFVLPYVLVDSHQFVELFFVE
ncbi:MAG: hypothetical protein K8F91_08195 [Candidatus Obscuribacterales bacterium]|nr:hypothetical protein [Candidatus Obscuribacterales bacterium]